MDKIIVALQIYKKDLRHLDIKWDVGISTIKIPINLLRKKVFHPLHLPFH